MAADRENIKILKIFGIQEEEKRAITETKKKNLLMAKFKSMTSGATGPIRTRETPALPLQHRHPLYTVGLVLTVAPAPA